MLSWIPNPRYTIGGIQRAVVGPWSEGLRPLRESGDQRVVTSLTPPVSNWYRLGCSDRATATQQSSYSKNGPQFSLRAVFPFLQGLLSGQLYALTQLLDQPVILLVQDMRGNWWMLGLRKGLNASMKEETGARAGDQIETIQLDGLEPEPWIYFRPSAGNAIYADAVPMDDDPAGTDDVYEPVDIGDGGGGGDL